MRRSITVRVPATSANCGAGFDVLGVALDLYNELTLTLTDEPTLDISVEGEGAGNIPRDEQNIVWSSVRFLLKQAGAENYFSGGQLRMKNAVPLSRGIGSSAAAIVCGLKAANVIIGNHFNRGELLNIATQIEGHPDNVAPAIYGGFTVNVTENGKAHCFTFLPKLRLRLVAAIPDFHLPTREARDVLPQNVAREDAVYNIGHAAMLVAGLMNGSERFVSLGLNDAMHQQYREKLVPGLNDVIVAAKTTGALGAVLSGAGPTVMAYCSGRIDAVAVGEAMKGAFAANGVAARIMVLGVDNHGAHIVNR